MFLVTDLPGGLYQVCTLTNAWTVYFHVSFPGIAKSGIYCSCSYQYLRHLVVFQWTVNVVLPQIVYELPTTAQWSFDVAWCPRNPAVVCTSSFDGHVSTFSLMGGGASGQDFHQQKVSALEFQSEQVQMMYIVYLYHSRILNNTFFTT